MPGFTRDEMERMATDKVCPCWYYDLADQLEETDDETLLAVFDNPMYLHYQNQVHNPVAIDEYIEELKQCPDFKPESITHEAGDHDAWHCICGNEPQDAGFYPCDTEGKEVEPTEKDWNGRLYVCHSCGRIIDQNTLEVIRKVTILA